MGLLSIFKKSELEIPETSQAPEKPKVENLSTSRSLFWGNSTSGTLVNEITAMQTAAVYACVRVIAESHATLPLHIHRRQKNGSVIAYDHPLYNVLHYEPNPEMSSFIFRETLMQHLLIYGNAYAQIIRNGRGEVVALYPLLPDKMTVSRDKNRKLIYTYRRDYDEKRSGDKKDNCGYVVFKHDEILHIRGLSFDGLVGCSPIAYAKNTIGLAIATDEYGAAFFQNSAMPCGVLEHPSEVEDKDELRDNWNKMLGGTKNASNIAILEDGLQFKPISISPEHSQFLQTRKYQISDIARIFRVPPHMIGDLEKSSFNNIEQQSLEFVMYTLQPWITRWEQAMRQSLLLPSEKTELYMKFNLDSLMRGDNEKRYNAYARGIQHGFLCPNDIRQKEDWNLIPEEEGGYNFMVNGNMLKLKDVGSAYGKKGGGDSGES